ncbi:MAG: exodeoxyribonuclease VII large subunit, partial [Methylobacterium sp.]|nr:exodeoxyribonuclease VII large subunit [Methylobacterium sp.]
KRPLPAFPRHVGIVTSLQAAALRDVLTTLRRRMPAIPVVIYPAPVQGKSAAGLIAGAIDTAAARAECDVLIVCRGGGSLEDLWPFNEEIVARAIAGCAIPVVSGVGHETDFTIADFVADMRAPTPTAAAELVTPDRQAMQQQIAAVQRRLQRQMLDRLQQRMQQLDFLARRLLHPGEKVLQQRERLGHLQARLGAALLRVTENAALRMKVMPQRLERAQAYQLQRHRETLQRLQQSLRHLGPHAVLERGYSLVQTPDGAFVRDSSQLAAGDAIALTFAEGGAAATIDRTR